MSFQDTLNELLYDLWQRFRDCREGHGSPAQHMKDAADAILAALPCEADLSATCHCACELSGGPERHTIAEPCKMHGDWAKSRAALPQYPELPTLPMHEPEPQCISTTGITIGDAALPLAPPAPGALTPERLAVVRYIVKDHDGYLPSEICGALSAMLDHADALDADRARLAAELKEALLREPRPIEADRISNGADETFVPRGWTARRCRHCGQWVFGGPTACEACVLRAERDAARRERDAAVEALKDVCLVGEQNDCEYCARKDDIADGAIKAALSAPPPPAAEAPAPEGRPYKAHADAPTVYLSVSDGTAAPPAPVDWPALVRELADIVRNVDTYHHHIWFHPERVTKALQDADAALAHGEDGHGE